MTFTLSHRSPTPLLVLIGFWLLPVAVGPAYASPPPRHTHVRLLADTKTITPGGRFTVGVVMTMDKGWHTYWKNPGEAGIPTRIQWTAPVGFITGETAWPMPHKNLESGDVLTYGYSNENMLLIPWTVPATARPGTTITLKARVEWLECESVCLPGEALVELTLPVRETAGEGANGALFEKYRNQTPPSFTPGRDVGMTTMLGKGVVEIHLTGGIRNADFYPELLGDVIIGRIAAKEAGGTAELSIPLSASRPVAGPLTLRGVLVYAVMDGETRTEAVEITLPPEYCATLHASGESSVPVSTSLLDQTFETTGTSGGTRPLSTYIVLAFLGGLLLNVMPCVLPVIALKVFGLVKMAGDTPARIKRLGWAFSAGILASFLVLASVVIVLQQAGQQVGWGFQFQEPLFVIAMAAVVFAFGLNLFGVFEIQLPATVVSGISSMVNKQQQGEKAYGASFGEGVFATILATPCTAPFLGSALGFAFSQPWWVILMIFASAALGMALPYLLLTTKPAWLRFLPRPGGWMETAKQSMGFLMMATLVWLLYILGRQIGVEGVIWTCAFLLTVGVACWLIGKFVTLTASRLKRRLTWIAACALVIGGYILFLESSLNVRAVIAGVPEKGGGSAAHELRGGVAWTPFSLAGLESELKEGKPVFVDFTADWCLTCKVNERLVLSDKSIVQKFEQLNVLAVRADWTNRNPDITKLLAKFGRSGVPLYVIFPPGKPFAPIVLPEVVTVGIVLEALERAVRK